jgi:hypothetical protein
LMHWGLLQCVTTARLLSWRNSEHCFYK